MKLEKWEAIKLLKLIANEMAAEINVDKGYPVHEIRERLKELMKYVDVIEGKEMAYAGQESVSGSIKLPSCEHGTDGKCALCDAISCSHFPTDY